MKVVLVSQGSGDFYVGGSPRIRISTPSDAPYADLIVSPNGAFWRSASERHYRFSSWDALGIFFETEGLLGAPGG